MSDIAIVFESFVRAGAQRHLVEILNGIKIFEPDLQCTLFLIAPVSQSWSSFLPEIRQCGIPVLQTLYRFDRQDGNGLIARSHNWLSRHWRERAHNRDFFSHLHEFRSVVCTEFFVADLLLPHLKPHQRLCFHLMEHLAQRSNTSHYRLLHSRRLHLIYMHASQIAQLPHLRNPNPSITWPVRLCPDHLQDSPITLSGPSGVLRIAHYSRISPMRLIDQVIDAFALLSQCTPARLRIAGFIEDPHYHQALLAQIDRLGLTDAVQFVDPVPSPAEDPARSEVDLVWMISLSGHVGYAGIEAMAAGLPTLLLEVDSQAHTSPLDPALKSLVCATPEQLVERSLELKDDPGAFQEQQAQLMRDRFITTKEAINELTAFYLGNP